MTPEAIKTIIAPIATVGALALWMKFGYRNGFDVSKDGTALLIVAGTFYGIFSGANLLELLKKKT